MAYQKDTIAIPEIPATPARKVAVVERNLDLSISSPFGQIPQIGFTRETLHMDGDDLVKRAGTISRDLTAEEFVAIVPEYKALLDSIPKALDLLSQRLPKWRAEQEAAARKAEAEG